ncbi:hypothetical protein TNCV_2887271 [Trichonephila clavipes]|nr:hypothetical protein TNCV_2887271 [Trichonephila clavipes]
MVIVPSKHAPYALYWRDVSRSGRLLDCIISLKRLLGDSHNHASPASPWLGKIHSTLPLMRSNLIHASDSRLRIVSLVVTECLEGGKWRQTESSNVVGEVVVALLIG